MTNLIVRKEGEEIKVKPHKEKKKIFDFKKGGLKSLIIIMAFLVTSVVVYNYSFSFTSSATKSANSESVNFTTGLEYIKEIESKLNSVVSNIKGAGNVKVMISISSSPELKVAENVEEKTVSTSSGSTTVTTTEPIIVETNGKDSPLILKETLPEINGVIVVSSGASDVKVKLDIITAVSTALGIKSNIVEVFVGI